MLKKSFRYSFFLITCVLNFSSMLEAQQSPLNQDLPGVFQVRYLDRPTGEGIPQNTVRIEYQLCFPNEPDPIGSVRLFDDSESRSLTWTALTAHQNCVGLTKSLVFKSTTISAEQIIRFEFENSNLNQVRRFVVNLQDLDIRSFIPPQSVTKSPENKSGNWGKIPLTAFPKSMMNFLILSKENALAGIQNVFLWLPQKVNYSNENANKIRLILNSEIYMIPILSNTSTACNSVVYIGKMKDVDIPGYRKLQNLNLTFLDHRQSQCRNLHKYPFELELRTIDDTSELQETGVLNAVLP